MAFREKRRLIKVGKSNGVVLPKPWVDFYGEQAKSLVIFADDVVVIVPEVFEKEAYRIIALFHKEFGRT